MSTDLAKSEEVDWSQQTRGRQDEAMFGPTSLRELPSKHADESRDILQSQNLYIEGRSRTK